MKTLRRLAYAALGIAFAHIVFGAIVRITGSGLGCGDHWPKCHGYWVPPFDRLDLVIEVSHRYLALALSLAVLALAFAALRRRREPGVGGPGGVFRPSVVAGLLVVSAALFGALTVKLELTNKYVIVVHLALAIATLATIALAAMRAGGLGAAQAVPGTGSRKTYRAAVLAAALAFLAVVLGGLTAHVLGANTSCLGFPHCRAAASSGAPLHIHLTHRVIAFLLLGHMIGLVIGVSRRRESPVVVWAARVALGTVVLQILVAAALVEMHLPPVLRSLHQAIGTMVWLSLFVLAVLARRASGGALGAALPPVSPLMSPDEGRSRGTIASGTAPGAAIVAHTGELPGAATAKAEALVASEPLRDEAAPADEEHVHEDPVDVAIEPEVWAAMSGASAAAFGVAEVATPAEASVDAMADEEPAIAEPAESAPADDAVDVREDASDDEPRDLAAATPVASLDDEVAAALEALMATSAVVDLNEAGEDEEDEPDREDKLAALQAELAERAALEAERAEEAERARIEAMLREAAEAERVALEGWSVVAPTSEAGEAVEAPRVEADPVAADPVEADVIEADVLEDDVVVVVEAAVAEPGEPAEASPVLAEVAQLPPRRPPTLAVLIARGADF